MAYQLSQDPNIGRTDTAFVMPQIDWSKEFSLYNEYIRHSNRYSDKDPSRQSAGEKSYLDYIQYSPPKEVVDQKVAEHLMSGHKLIEEQASYLYKNYNYDPPAEQLAILEKNKSAFELYQNQIIEATKAYNEQRKIITSKEGRADHDYNEFIRREKLFLEEGVPVFDFLSVNPADPSQNISEMLKEQEKDSFDVDLVEEGGIVTTKREDWYKGWYNESESGRVPNMAKLQEYIFNEYKKNAPFRMGIEKDFAQTTDEERGKFTDPLSWAISSGENDTPAPRYANLLQPKQSESKRYTAGREEGTKDKTYLKYDDTGFYRVPHNKQAMGNLMFDSWLKFVDGELTPVTKDQEELPQDQRFIAVGPYKNDNGEVTPMAVFAYKKNGKEFTQQEIDKIDKMAKEDVLSFFMQQQAGVFDKSSGISLMYKPFEEVESSLTDSLGFEFEGLSEWKKKFSGSSKGPLPPAPN